MMQRPSDEMLVAYLDGEVDEATAVEIESCLERDSELQARLLLLTESDAQIRDAFDEILREPVPERLIAAARGRTAAHEEEEELPSATILSFGARLATTTARKGIANRRWGLGLVAAASLSFLMIGAGGGYLAGMGGDVNVDATQPNSTATSWLDNIAGYHNLLISSANGAESTVFDVPAGAETKLPSDVRIPDLKPWSLAFQGARKLMVEGKPAYQFYYTTDNKSLGPITITVTNTTRPDSSPTFAKRAGVNLLYWRHQGHGYALVGSADKGWMWGIANDVEFQLKAI
ncbi:membrane protein [Aliidongia dinghuensis]|uniref:Membrane protein n=2 Tax=Aliidongia dinghuensis TaxID=1867774 RepID=A0A8J2YY18_9PROT|nr:membrane protein [Aliidongia dinghuensis]